jgi:hypothetical protein
MATTDPDSIPPIPLPPVEAAPVVPAPAVPAPVETSAPQPTYGPPQPTYAPAAYAPQPAGPAQGLAIASLVCGIGGLVLIVIIGVAAFLPALAAIITGHIAQKRQPHARAFWITGLITGYVGAAISLILGVGVAVFLIAIFSNSMYFG